jgi:hypothetical protein
VRLGADQQNQFGIVAKEDLPPDTFLYELAGMLSVDYVDDTTNVITTRLSEIRAVDGTKRVLFGPIRFVNHSCDANAVVRVSAR